MKLKNGFTAEQYSDPIFEDDDGQIFSCKERVYAVYNEEGALVEFLTESELKAKY